MGAPSEPAVRGRLQKLAEDPLPAVVVLITCAWYPRGKTVFVAAQSTFITCACYPRMKTMLVAAQSTLVLAYLLAASLSPTDAARCSEVSIWTVEEIDRYLTSLPVNDVKKCVEVALLSSIVASRQDGIQCIVRHRRFVTDSSVVVRVAWYAYVIARRNSSPVNRDWKILQHDLLPLVKTAYRLDESEILLRFARHYEANPLTSITRSTVLNLAPDLSGGHSVEQHRPYPIAYDWSFNLGNFLGARPQQQPGLVPPNEPPALHPILGEPSASRPQTQSQGAAVPSAQRRRHRRTRSDDQDPSMSQGRNTRPRTRSPMQRVFIPPPNTNNRNVERSSRVSPHPSADQSSTVGSVTTSQEQGRRVLQSVHVSQASPVSSWRYLVKDGTQQEQGQAFLDTLFDMIDEGDDRVRGRLFVKSESSPAIDENGLSASLIHFAATELVTRLGKRDQILYSQSMEKAFVPRSPTTDTHEECRDLLLLGALIGIIDNYRGMGPNRIVSLPVPLPVVAFRALLTHGPVAITDEDARETALAAIYKQYCGDLSPAQCKADRQLDVDQVFPHVPGADYDSADSYLRELTGLLLNSPAFRMVSQGYLATAREPLRKPETYPTMHETVIADSVVTMAKLVGKLKMVTSRCYLQHAINSCWKVLRVLASMSDDGRADFVEAATGTRSLPLTRDIHSIIKVKLAHCNGITFRTCSRTVEVPFALACDMPALHMQLQDSIKEFVGRGITSSSHNIP
ncbi:HECT domain-containing protein [Plasmodiophora brassicae]